MITAFTVDRATWLHGEYAGNSYLERPEDGKKCCLGFLCLAAGIPREAVVGRTTIGTLPMSYIPLLPAALFHDLYSTRRLMILNDVPTHETVADMGRYGIQQPLSSDAYREQLLTEGFREVGIELTFTGEYPTQETA